MSTEEIARAIQFAEETGMSVAQIVGAEEPTVDPNFVPKWRFQLGQPLIRPELVNKLPTQMHRFHQWYMKKSKNDLEMFAMLVRPDDFAGVGEKLVWFQFKDIYELYHLDSLNTDLIMSWCL